MRKFELIAPCHFGLEAVLKKEIIDLGYEISKVEDGRITFIGDEESICRVNVFSRTAEIDKLEKEVAIVKKEKKDLQNEVSLLNDDDYVTRYARENYVFTKDGEQVVILPDIDQEK